MKFSLPRIVYQCPDTCLHHALLDAKAGGNEHILGCGRGKPLDADIASEPLHEIGHKLGIGVQGEGEEILLPLLPLPCHAGAPQYLQLVDFQGCHGQGVQDVCLGKDVIPVFAGEAEHEVHRHGEAIFMAKVYGIHGLARGVPAVHTRKGTVVEGLASQFYRHGITSLADGYQKGKHIVVYAIGPCGHHQAHHILHGKGLIVAPAQDLQGGIGGTVCLEVGKVLHPGVLALEKLLSCLHLLRDGGMSAAICGIERLAQAERASSLPHPAVAVGTGKASVQHYLLQLHS